MLGVVDASPAPEPATGRERGSAHDARRPDVAEDAALVAEPVHQPGLLQQVVELSPVLVGNLFADVGDQAFDI